MRTQWVVALALVVGACGGGKDDNKAGGGSSGSGSAAADPKDKKPDSGGSGGTTTSGGGSATTPAGSGGGTAATGSGSGSAAGSAATELTLATGEKKHEPAVEFAWQLKNGTVNVSLLDVHATPAAPLTQKLAVAGWGKRHDVVRTSFGCDKAELWAAPDQRVVFRCEATKGKEKTADEWLLRWREDKGYPTRYRHWEGLVDQKEPKWSNSPHPLTGKGRPPAKKCCCKLEEGDADTIFTVEDRAWCQKKDVGGKCVKDDECKKDDAIDGE